MPTRATLALAQAIPAVVDTRGHRTPTRAMLALALVMAVVDTRGHRTPIRAMLATALASVLDSSERTLAMEMLAPVVNRGD